MAKRPLTIGVAADHLRREGLEIARGVAQYSGWRAPVNLIHVRPDVELVGRFLHAKKVDGVILQSCIESDEVRKILAPLRCPIVDCGWGSGAQPGAALVDLAAASKVAAEHLLDAGYRTVGVLEWTIRYITDAARSVVEARGKAFSAFKMDLSWPHDANVSVWNTQYDQYLAWLNSLQKPAGIILHVYTDLLDFTTICRTKGFVIPEDIGLISISVPSFYGELTGIEFSSVNVPMVEAGTEAARILNEWLNHPGEPPPPGVSLSSVNLVPRHSTNVVLHPDGRTGDALRFIRDNACNGTTVAKACKALGITRQELTTRVKSATGRTPLREIRHFQMIRAKEMLRGSDQTIYRIASECGFTNPDHFSTVFLRINKMTPRAYRKSGV